MKNKIKRTKKKNKMKKICTLGNVQRSANRTYHIKGRYQQDDSRRGIEGGWYNNRKVYDLIDNR